jgi:DNA polymerase I
MERHGIRVDPARLEAFAKELERDLDNLTREIYQLAGGEFTIASPKQLAQILFEKLKLPPIRRTKTGYSTDADVLTELALGHPLPAKILEHRSLAKLKGTYADTLPGLINPSTGRIHTTFNQLVASTGRLSSQDPNLMNIPIRTELGRRIRQAFIPEAGWQFVAADYSQIELRILAHLSEEPALIESFGRGEDIHTRTASEVFKIPAASVTSLQRTIAKSANYAILYGVSAFGLSQATKIDQKVAQKYISDYFASHPRVRAFIDRTLAEGRERGHVSTLLGRRRYLPDLASGNPVARNAAERMAMNAPVQGTASDMIKIAMVRVQAALTERGLRARMLRRCTTSSCSRRRRTRSPRSRRSRARSWRPRCRWKSPSWSTSRRAPTGRRYERSPEVPARRSHRRDRDGEEHRIGDPSRPGLRDHRRRSARARGGRAGPARARADRDRIRPRRRHRLGCARSKKARRDHLRQPRATPTTRGDHPSGHP